MATEKETQKVKEKQALKVPSESFYGTGKRKTAIAKVWLFKGSGTVVINDKNFDTYLPSDMQRQVVLTPLAMLGLNGKYDCFIRTIGGGLSGQVDACKLGISRALLQLNEEFRKPLKDAGLLSRDSREKERKKYGLKRARKAQQYRKR